MANTGNSDKWYFTKEQLENTPSRKCGYDSYKELSYRQQAANFIQDMGQRLKVSQLCINTAIVYMHRFYVFHSFTHFPWHQMAAAALFLAAKVEEQPRKLEYVIRAVNICRNPKDTSFDINSERYISQSQDLVFNENVLLQTLGFDVAIDHPHTHVVRCCHLVRASKDLAQTSYFMASNSLHLTTMCIQYKPTVVACFCIMVACKWSNWEIPLSNEKKEWFSYVDPTVTAELLQQLTEEFLVIFESCPSRLKEKIMAIAENASSMPNPHINSPFDQDPKKIIKSGDDSKDSHQSRSSHDKDHDPHKHRSRPHEPGTTTLQQRDREYRERKERERLAQQHGQKHAMVPGKPSHSHHKPTMDPKLKPHSQRDYLLKPNVTSSNSINNYPDSRLSYGSEKRVMDPSRSRIDPNKFPPKHDPSNRRHEDPNKPHIKTETDVMKKHVNPGVHDKNSAYMNKPSNSTSQKTKSPLIVDSTKSVPKPNTSLPNTTMKPHYNGSSNGGSYNLLTADNIKQEIKQEPKEVIQPPAQIKRPSLFSPEKTPPHKVPQLSNSVLDPLPSASSLVALSPLSSPVGKRNRNSSSSEPELRPVMKKIDQVEGFENIMRDSTIGINKLPKVPDIVVKKEAEDPFLKDDKSIIQPLPHHEHKPLVNGIETNPTLISNLLKEAPTVSHLPSVTVSNVIIPPVTQPETTHNPVESKEKDHHHHKSKKKNKEKHKHKDKDRSRDEKEKKKKHKDKDREKHRHKEKHTEPTSEIVSNEPIKIKIQKDKILPESPALPSIGLKIKIPKDKIKTEDIGEPSKPSSQPSFTGGLKIKIPKEVITNCNMDNGSASNSSSKKRDRDRNSYSGDMVPPTKISKSSYKESKHSYSSKVTQMGDGETTQHKLADSKYINKGSTT